MADSRSTRRAILQAALTAMPAAAFDWEAWPDAQPEGRKGDDFDVVVIGSGLGGLSCAAAFARKGYRPLVLEQHDRPGGYATAFRRPGGFEFDVSLHSTVVGERNGIHNLIGGFPEITEVEFVPHPWLYRAIFPDHDIRVPQHDAAAYTATLEHLFPAEAGGIESLFREMAALWNEVGKGSGAAGEVEMNRFPEEFPTLYRCSQQTWGQMMDRHIHDPRLRAILSALWVYFGLPPSRLASFYYALPTLGYLREGGYYPKGRSQTISNALMKFIQARGGRVALGWRVSRILVKDGAAYGVRCENGDTFRGRAVVSNASSWRTFHDLLEDRTAFGEYMERMAGFSTSLSCFQVFLGLKTDLVKRLGIREAEIFLEAGYDPEADYEGALTGDAKKSGLCVTLYDNLVPGYSPGGKNTINLIALQGYKPWEQFETEYRAGRKTAYRAAKERMADALIAQAEERLLPGLTKAIQVKEAATPLTNVRYTSNYRGAIYGWDQTLDNSGEKRLGHRTPVRNLYLAGAWTRPGHGYGGVIQSGLECFTEVLRDWV